MKILNVTNVATKVILQETVFLLNVLTFLQITSGSRSSLLISALERISTKVKVLMALADDELTVGKSHARNGEWVDITMRKVNTLLSMDEDADWILYCMICKREDHKTSNHEMYIALLKRSENYKAQPYQYASSSKQILRAKAKPFPPCTHCGFNDHIPDDYRNYPYVIHVEALYTPPLTTMNLITSKERHITEPIWYLDSGCSRSMTGVKSYLHKYVDQPGPKFDDKQGTIFNANKEIVPIAPRRNDVYVLDMSSLTPNEACFFAKASESVNWLWHKRLSHLNFKNINKLVKQNKVLGFPSLVYSKDKPCTTCEKGKHHRASFKTKQNFSITKCLHLLHMDLFGPISPMSINHEKYTLVIVDEYSRSHYQKSTRSYYSKEILWGDYYPIEILGDTTQRDIGRYYPKRYWEILPKEILGDTTQRDISMGVWVSRPEKGQQGGDLSCLVAKGCDRGAFKLLGDVMVWSWRSLEAELSLISSRVAEEQEAISRSYHFRGSRKLKPEALSLYVGEGHRAAVEAIGSYHLCLPSRLVLVLHNSNYAPSITRGIILVSCLYDDGFINHFDENNTISVSMNNLVYFSAIPRNGIYEIDLSNSNINDCSMYSVSNKRAKTNLDSSLLWHCRLRHISKKHIEKLQHDGLPNSTHNQSFEKCVSCMSRKMAQKPYTHQVERAKHLLGLLHTDEVENQLGKTIKSLRSNRGGEYMSQEFLDHLKEHGIIAHRTPTYTPQHNGVSERRNRTLLDMVRSMISQITLPKSFWDYALESAARILNMVSTKKALVKRDTLTKPKKLEPRSIKCIFIGYPKETMGYFFYYPPENKIFVTRNAKFLENSLMTQEASGSLEDLEIIQEEDTHPSINTSLDHDKDDQEIDEPQSDINPIRRSTRTRRALDRMCLYIDAEEHDLGDHNEPANYKVALLDLKSKNG
ncbi:retrotransposon protein, putative, ty1-copia subclass [Tanacetum coccineum]|uniref:Retrotransposon protein, putative, ty1-copia subclass n=1 Tax=Tanacetum coccineum TaxID=301880 RepID=A0ABQ4YSA6_9ASTR